MSSFVKYQKDTIKKRIYTKESVIEMFVFGLLAKLLIQIFFDGQHTIAYSVSAGLLSFMIIYFLPEILKQYDKK